MGMDAFLDFLGMGGDEKPSSGNVVSNSDPGQKGGGFFNSSNFYSSVINAGLGLAGTYFEQAGKKELAEQAAADRMKELAFIAANQKGGGGGGGGGSGSAMKIAKMNNLSQLYANYANLMAKAADTESAAAIEGGKLMQAPINIRASRL